MKEKDFGDFNWGAVKLSALLSFVFGLQAFYNLELAFQAFESPFWKFFTSIVAHGGPEHLFNNLFFIALFGSIYELHTSEKEFYKAFFLSALFANLAAFVFFPDSYIVGASGGAMGVLAALSVYRPNQTGLALGIPAPMWAVLGIYIFTNFAGVTGGGNTAYEAHLLGIVSGAYIGYMKRNRPLISSEDEEDGKEEDEFSNWERKISKWEEKYMKN
jgi:membrane associated rhomboid family serine protease